MRTMTYKCPCCGAALTFDGGERKLVCDSCGTQFDADGVSAAEQYEFEDADFEQIDWNAPGNSEPSPAHVYTCQSCGAELVTDANTTATECAYCGSPIILTSNLNSGVQPEYVLPFKVSEDQARQMFSGYFHGKRLIPNVFERTRNRISEIRRLYVPFWLFSCRADVNATYNAARISYQAAVQSYQDQKAILDKQVGLASDNVANTKALFEIGAASQLEVDQAELNYQNAVAGRNSALSQLEAGMQNAKSGVEQLDTALENVDPDGNVLAPQSGTLVTMNATEGSYISNSMPLVVIDGAEQMKVTASVSEALVPKIAAGDSADVTVSAANVAFTATIRSVERAANMQTKLYTVVLTVPANVTGLMNGMFADVTFHTDTAENTIVVPTESILTSNGVQYVYVVEENTAKYVPVTTGLIGSGVTEVTSGLTEGQQLVTVGQAYLADGDPVRVVGQEG